MEKYCIPARISRTYYKPTRRRDPAGGAFCVYLVCIPILLALYIVIGGR